MLFGGVLPFFGLADDDGLLLAQHHRNHGLVCGVTKSCEARDRAALDPGSSGAVSSSWSGGMRGPPGLAQLLALVRERRLQPKAATGFQRPKQTQFSSQAAFKKLVPLTTLASGLRLCRPARTLVPQPAWASRKSPYDSSAQKSRGPRWPKSE